MKTNYVKTGLYSRYINLGFFVLMAALLLSSLVTGCKQKAENKTTPPIVQTDSYRIIIKGDERTNIPENTLIEIPLAENKTWSDIKEQAKAKVTLKSEWNNDNYEVYEWRFNNENGELLTETEQMNKPLTVYAVTNYTKFNIKKLNNELNLIELTNDKGKGYTESEPKGKIIIPDRIYYIDGLQDSETGAFSECNKITSVRFPASLDRIFDYAFNKCTGLTSIDLSRCTKLTVIDSFTFQNCTALTKVDLSRCKELGGIGKHAFSECKSLATVDLSGCKKLTKIGNSAFSECTGLASVNLSGCINLVTIDKYAFSECTGLASVDLSDCVELRIIDQYAFYKCTGLTSVDLSGCKKLTKIENSAFSGCTNAEIRLPENITTITIDYYAFSSPESFCKKVLIKSGPNFNRIKQLVIDSGYPEDRIESY